MAKETAFDKLKETISGQLVVPGDSDYEEARQIWNTRLAGMPAAILQCANAADAAAGVKCAKAEGLGLAVRGGGHSYAGLGTGDDALLIDFSLMKAIEIDAARQCAWVEPGVRWGEFNESALAHGLAPTSGTVSSVGVSGFTLGGGSGWLTRKYGLALDNLLSVEVVTAAGDVVTASESDNPDLFWGIRGGAGNFGIVTRFEFKLHPIPAEIFAGQIIYPFALARKVMQAYRAVMATAPDGFCCYPAAFRIPPIDAFPEALHGQVVVDLIMAHIGDIAEGGKVAQPLREIGEPIMDLCAPQPYAQHLQVFDAGSPPGQRWYSRAHYMNSLTDEAIDAFLEHAANITGAFTFAYFEPMGGAAGRIAPEATAFPHRKTAFGFHILAGWTGSDEDASVMQWTRDFHAAMAPFASDGVYVNLLAEDEPDRVRKAYGSNFERLAELKKKWDPANRFRGNQNIAPQGRR